MNKLGKKLLLLGVAASLGTTMVACSQEGAKAPETTKKVEQEAETEHSHALSFEWRGKMAFEEGEYTLKFNKNDGENMVNIGFLKEDGRDIHDVEHDAIHMMEHDSKKDHLHLGEKFHAEHFNAYEIELNGKTGVVQFDIHEGEYQVFFQHMPEEFDLEILDAKGEKVEVIEEEVYEEGTELD